MKYINRITDEILKEKLETFGGVLIEGPKGCGKTTSAKHFAKSLIELQDENKRNDYLETAAITPSKLLEGAKPRLIDEWQDAPKIWGAVRKSIDDENGIGMYILTGSSSKKIKTPHTGTMRISRMYMYPMSLYESGESNGEVSLRELFDKPKSFDSCRSDLSMDDLIYAICRGGWPSTLKIENKALKLRVAKDLVEQICKTDIMAIDGIDRNENIARALLKSYARNISTLATADTILKDVKGNTDCGKTTFFDYISVLERLFIISDINSWNPCIRSKTSIRSSKKRNFIDPSIACAALKISPEYFNTDFKTLGFLFESLCHRDLKVYSSKLDGDISYYRDRFGLEADGVLHLSDGRYALIEYKLGYNRIETGAKHLLKIEQLIKNHNDNNPIDKISLPTLKMIITATEYGYRRPDGVLIVPIGCLKD